MVEPLTPNIYEALRLVQIQLKAPKGQRNSFGNYDYRSAEDILEAVKPILADNNLTLLVADEVVLIGDRYYIKASARVCNEAGDRLGVSAYAREAEDKKGMDSAQITGATSSYARKYALNGLFAIDDSKDADTDEHRDQSNNAPARKSSSPEYATDKQRDLIRSLSKQAGFTPDVAEGRLKTIETKKEAFDAIEKLKGIVAEKEAA